MKTSKILLLITLLLSATLRLVNLENVPPPLNVDEAANAYDAYALLKTGRDQWGNVLPITMRAFNDYRRPATTYSAIPFIAIFGLSIFAIRAMAAFWGWWAIVFMYRLARDMYGEQIGIISAFILALSPWHIVFSRLGVEVSGPLLTSVIAGMDFCWRWYRTQKNPWLIASGIAFCISLYSYTVAQAFTPLMLMTLVFAFLPHFRKRWKIGMVTSIMVTLLVLPLVLTLITNPVTWNRLDTIAILKPPYRTSIPKFVTQWAGYFTPSFLFSIGDANPIHHPPGSGQLLWLEAILIPLGALRYLIALLRQRSFRIGPNKGPISRLVTNIPVQATTLVIFWVVLGALPAALTRQDMGSPNAMRGILSLPAWVILSTLGLDTLWQLFNKLTNHHFMVRTVTLGLFILNATSVLNFYYGAYTKQYARAFEYGIQQAMGYALEHEEDYTRIILTDWISQPHIFSVFFNRYDPYAFQHNHAEYGTRLSEKLTAWGNKYETGDVDKLYDEIKHGLFIARPHMLAAIEPVMVVYHPDGSIAFKIFTK